MSLKDRINSDVKDAMRAGDKQTLGTLRFVMAAIKQIEVDERIVLDDARITSLLDKLTKQRKDSIAQFKKANRDDLVAKEEFELSVITTYLPEQLSTEEISQYVNDAIAATGAVGVPDMGKVMAHLKPLVQGKADMGQVGSMVRSCLSSR